MRRWSSTLLLLLILLVSAHAATAQIQVVSAYVYGLSGTRVATFPTGYQSVGTLFAVQGLPANSTWKLLYYGSGGSLSATASGSYNNSAPLPGTVVTLAIPRSLSLTKGDWHIQLAINGQAAKDIYFAAGLGAPVLDHAKVIGQDFFTEQTQFDVGNNLIGSTAWLKNIPAGTWVRLRYQRPDGKIAADNTWDPQGNVSYDGYIGARWFVNLDQPGTWHLIFDLSGQTLVTKEFYVGDFVTQVKLSIPEYGDGYQPNDILDLNLYIKGHSIGNTHLTGRLLVDEQTVASLNFDADLSSGNWQQHFLNPIFAASLQGKHTIRAVIDSPNSVSSGKIISAVSGFHLLKHSFRFKNPTGGFSDGTPFSGNGMCLGMARVANYDFMKGIQIPLDSPTPSRDTTTKVYSSFLGGNAWLLALPFVNGGNGWNRLSNYANDDDAIASETDRIHNHLQNLQSWVVLTTNNRSATFGNHAVVATAEFYCEAPYIVGFENDNYNVHLFPVYDSNRRYGDYGYIAIFENTAVARGSGRFSMAFSGYNSFHFPVEFSQDQY